MATTQTAPRIVQGPTPQDNVVTLNEMINNIVYNGTVRVTGGQPYDPPPVPSVQWQVDFVCGRHGGDSVASDFKSICGGQDANMLGLSTSASHPAQLNFYYGVNVTFFNQTSTVTLYLGQGNDGFGSNNWWIGGPQLQNGGQGYAVITLPDGSSINVAGDGNDNTFKFYSS